ncbi:FAD-dependent oxidoreductase [candidate division KSB1 bacterium]|nr:FAD-dependent oxidoreductase [candidate division KSB1 bacterium]
MKCVIIGAGIAGVTAAETIKKINQDIDVVLIGKEQYLPYNRYRLTDYLCNVIDDTQLYFTSFDFFKKNNIKYRNGEYIKSINPAEKTIKYYHNEVMGYDKLLIATGGSQHLGPILKPFSQYIQSYYTLQDILLLKKFLPDIKHCVVYGENLSNLDLLAGLCNLDKKITYIIKGEKARFPLLKEEFEQDVHYFLKNKGIQCITNDKLVNIKKEKKKFTVETLNQKIIKTDIVFAWDDSKPNISLLEGTAIHKKTGILVNQYMETSEQDIFAAGDCAEIYHPILKNYWINFGWPNAREQGEIAGKNIAGEKALYQIHETLTFHLEGKPIKARWWE